MDLDRGLEHAINGDAILFVGAGFSIGASNLRDAPFKSGSKLAQDLAVQANLSPETDLEDAAEEFALLLGEDRLIEELQQEFTARKIAEWHERVAKIPWRCIYTTNYDNILELAYAAASRSLMPVTLNDDVREAYKGSTKGSKRNPITLCVHLNGYVGRLTRDTIWSQIKLTDTSYVTTSVSQSPWATMFRQDLSVARAVFFVGYSLADLDIRRIIFEDQSLSNKSFFVIGREPSQTTVRRTSRFGQPLSIDTSQFATQLEEKRRVYKPPEDARHISYCVRSFQLPASPSPPTDQNIFDLLLYGKVRSEFVAATLFSGAHYYLERSVLNKAIEFIDHGVPALVIHSDLGNGKTMFVEGLKCRAIERGYSVYSVVERTFEILTELKHVTKPETKTIIVIEDYPDWLEEIKFLSMNANDKVSLVLTARTSPHDVMIPRLLSALGREDIHTLSLDQLTREEIEWLVDFQDLYGLWGERAAWPKERKVRFIMGKCRSEFHAVLLMLLESPQIISRFEQVINQLNEKQDFYEALTTILVLTVLQASSSINKIVDLCGEHVLSTQFRRNPTIRQLLDFESSEFHVRSSVAAQFILQRVTNPNTTVDVLVEMARIADRNSAMQDYQSLFQMIMRFSRVQRLLPEKGMRPAVLSYYEQIKSLKGARQHPLFWLQYAIASLVLEDFERAGRYFDTAYSHAKSRDYNTFQIDNHFARYLLARAIASGDSSSCMTDFRKARKIINHQIQEEKLHYPYRVASAYAGFYDAFEPELTIKNRDEVERAAKFVNKRIGLLPEMRRREKYVAECANSMEYILLRIEESRSLQSE